MPDVGENCIELAGSRYRHVVWDWNGTLLDDVAIAVEVVNRVLTRFGAAPLQICEYHEHFDYPVIDFYRRAGVDLKRWPYEQVAAVFTEEFAKDWKRCPLQPDARQALARIGQAGVDQSLLTASPQDVIEESMVYYGLGDYFVALVGMDNVFSHGKAEQGRQWMGRLDHAPHDVLLIGDTTHDYDVAQAMGVDCVLMSFGHNPRHKLSRCGVPLFDSLEELFGGQIAT